MSAEQQKSTVEQDTENENELSEQDLDQVSGGMLACLPQQGTNQMRKAGGEGSLLPAVTPLNQSSSK